MPRTFVSLVLVFSPALTMGESGRHGAHVHGVAELTLAQEGRDLEIMLTSPAISIVGFESKAVTDAQVQAVEAAEAALRNGAELFTFEGTQCEMRDVVVDVSALLEGAEDEQTAHDDHDKHEGDHHDEHDEHDKHASESDHHVHASDSHPHDDGETHSDIKARYTYRCAEDGQLEALRVGSDGLPFSLETINVMWVSDRDQGATELTADRRRIEFR